MRVFVQVIDTRNGISQNGMIEEPVQRGFEVANALGHFGISITSIEWISEFSEENYRSKFGKVKDTSKIVNIIVI